MDQYWKENSLGMSTLQLRGVIPSAGKETSGSAAQDRDLNSSVDIMAWVVAEANNPSSDPRDWASLDWGS